MLNVKLLVQQSNFTVVSQEASGERSPLVYMQTFVSEIARVETAKGRTTISLRINMLIADI